MKSRRPTTSILNRVFAWLRDNQFSVYGDNEDLDTGDFLGGQRDFTKVSDVLKLVRTRKRNKLKGITPRNRSYDHR